MASFPPFNQATEEQQRLKAYMKPTATLSLALSMIPERLSLALTP
ncbi:hypothetical protein [Paenibacillus illinoisensis]|nr:hypothetical protein [Paenibacillus illinoisensis]